MSSTRTFTLMFQFTTDSFADIDGVMDAVIDFVDSDRLEGGVYDGSAIVPDRAITQREYDSDRVFH